MQSSTNTSDPLPMGVAIVMWCQTAASLTLSVVSFYFFWLENVLFFDFRVVWKAVFLFEGSWYNMVNERTACLQISWLICATISRMTLFLITR